MVGDWRSLDFDQALAIQRGHDLPEQARQLGDVPIIGSAGLTGWHNESRASGPGVTIGRSGASAGVITYVSENFWPHNTCLYVTDFLGNDPRYCYYWLLTLGLERYAGGSAQPSLNRNHLSRIKVTLPTTAEQQRIAELLGALDDKIELNRRMAETLGAMARALFKSWFVDFDPVRARAKGRPSGLADDLAARFPDCFGEDGIPQGWSMRTVGSLFDVSGGNTPSTDRDDYWDGPHQWASPRDLSSLNTPVLLRTTRQLTDVGLAQASSGLLPVGSLLLSSRAPIGYMAFTTAPTAINQGFAGIIRKEITTSYAWAWCHAHMGMITANAGGSTFPEISKSVFRRLPMLAPAQPVLRAFGDIADRMIERMIAAVQEQRVLAELRDTLLPKLISGEVRIANAECRVAAA